MALNFHFNFFFNNRNRGKKIEVKFICKFSSSYPNKNNWNLIYIPNIWLSYKLVNRLNEDNKNIGKVSEAACCFIKKLYSSPDEKIFVNTGPFFRFLLLLALRKKWQTSFLIKGRFFSLHFTWYDHLRSVQKQG